MISRSWLLVLADEYADALDLRDENSRRHAAEKACEAAANILKQAPWHFRFIVFVLESVASLWCVLYRIAHFGQSSRHEITTFEKIPLFPAPLLRLYRSLLAISWFEDSAVLAAYSIRETPEERQARFADMRNAS